MLITRTCSWRFFPTKFQTLNSGEVLRIFGGIIHCKARKAIPHFSYTHGCLNGYGKNEVSIKKSSIHDCELKRFRDCHRKIEFHSAIYEIYLNRNRPSYSMASISAKYFFPVTNLFKIMFHLAPTSALPKMRYMNHSEPCVRNLLDS